jgi:Yip1-like protein
MSEEREWWRRVLAVPVRPRVAFAGLRDDRPEAMEARQEPILALILLAGIAGILATPAWHTLMDDLERDALVVAVLTFIGGGLYGAVGYWIVGGALYLALRGLGSPSPYRRARHLVALSVVPLVLSLLVLPIELAGYGGDVFRSGGGDEGAPETVFLVLRLGFVAWSLGLLVVGIQELEGWTWGKVAGAVALFALVLAAAFAIPTLL